MALLDAHPGIGVVGGYYLLVDERRGERYVRMPPTTHEAIIPALAKSIPIAHTIATFRRQAWAEAGGYPPVANLEDQLLWLSAAKLGWRFANVPEVVGEHYVHDTSFFHRSYKYIERQRDLARVQAKVVRELGLPKWMYLFPLGRHAYAYFPTGLKRVVRRDPRGVPGARCVKILFLSTSMGMGGADQQLAVGRAGAPRPGARRPHRLAHAAGADGAGGAEPRAFPPSRWRCGAEFPIRAASRGWRVWSAPGGPTWCTATWSTPT